MQPLDSSLRAAERIQQLVENKNKLMEIQKKKIQYEVWKSNELTNTSTIEQIERVLAECEELLKALQVFRQHMFSKLQQHRNETCLIPSQFLEAWSILIKELEESRLPPLLEHLEKNSLSKRQLDDILRNIENCIAFVLRWKYLTEK